MNSTHSLENKVRLPYAVYKDKVMAGWIGKSIGGVIGAPFEAHKELKDLTLDTLWPEHLAPNDDLDLQVVWLEAMQERGLYLTSHDLADFWRDRCWYSFCEYGVFLNNVQRGIAPPLSGTWNNHYFLNSEGCPIRSDIWGYVAPNNPALAAELARLDGQLDHGEISIQVEQFLAATSSRALVTDDLEDALAAGLSVLPADSKVATTLHRVREIAHQYPNPRHAWRVTIREFGDRNGNDAITNHALTLLVLFLAQGDLKRAMLLCANFGWDTDCTASTSAALLATLSGTAGLPADWLEKLGKTLICGINVKHQGVSFEAFTEDTCRLGVEMAAARNPMVEFVDAPHVEVREPPAPRVHIRAEYLAEPVLWRGRCTPVRLHLCNPLNRELSGSLHLTVPEGTRGRYETDRLTLAPGEERIVDVGLERAGHGLWVRDKNLFWAHWTGDQGETDTLTFGLGGARQWQVYGPYWDMWDRTKNAICPYNNDKLVGGPFAANLTGDCYNQYAHLEFPYLDEARLLREDLPDELPVLLEHGEDHLTTPDFGGFRGQACYYLVRTIRSTVPDQLTHAVIGRTGPVQAWLDGEELGAADDVRAWAHLDSTNFKMTLTGQPQRLVFKLIRLGDAVDFSLYFMGRGDPTGKSGISNILDCLEDLALDENVPTSRT